MNPVAKYIKPERRRLVFSALGAWLVLVSFVFINWLQLAQDVFDHVFATDFSGTHWVLESADRDTVVYLKLTRQGAVEASTLLPSGFTKQSDSSWERMRRNGLSMKLGQVRYQILPAKLNIRNVAAVSSWIYVSSNSKEKWYLTSLDTHNSKPVITGNNDLRKQLGDIRSSEKQPAVSFIDLKPVTIPGLTISASERLDELVRIVHRPNLYRLSYVIKAHGPDKDAHSYLLLKEGDGVQRIAADDGISDIPVEVEKRAKELLNLGPGRTTESSSPLAGLVSSTRAGTGDGAINALPRLILVLSELDASSSTIDLTGLLQRLLVSLANKAEQEPGSILVLVSPTGSGKKEDGRMVSGLSDFVLNAAETVEVKTKIKPRASARRPPKVLKRPNRQNKHVSQRTQVSVQPGPPAGTDTQQAKPQQPQRGDTRTTANASLDSLAGVPIKPVQQSLEGTVWSSRTSDGKQYQLHFKENGKLHYKSSNNYYTNGTWKQDGSKIYFEMNNRYAEHFGALKDGKLDGYARNSEGRRWIWTAEPFRY